MSLLLIIPLGIMAETTTSKFSDNAVGDIEGITESMLYSRYWQKKIPLEQELVLSEKEIIDQNERLFKQNVHMLELEKIPSSINRKDLIEKIESISSIPSSARYYSNGQQVSRENYKTYSDELDLNAIENKQSVQFGLVVKRTNLRTFPTADPIFKSDDDINLDRFQETALFPTQVVAIFHQSRDQQWLFVSSYNYSAWVKKSDIAVGDKQLIFKYKNSEPFIVITGDKVNTSYNPYNVEISDVQLDMGIRIPLVESRKKPNVIGGQNTYASHVISLPTRNQKGKLILQPALIAKSKDVNIGYLPFTRKNVIEQSFKFLGERYGWGHSFNARDCTGFVGEVYKSFGILMPRNSGQQGKSQQGQNIRFSKSASVDEKINEIKNLEIGDLIYIPGHVMLYLGSENNKPFIIHDVSGLSYYKSTGEYYKSSLNGVSVTPLLPLQLNQETTYLDRIYNLKKIK